MTSSTQSTQSPNGTASCVRRHRATTFRSCARRCLRSLLLSAQELNAREAERRVSLPKNRVARDVAALTSFDSDQLPRHVAKAEATLTVRMRCTATRRTFLLPRTSSTHWAQSPNGAASCSRRHRTTTFSSPRRRRLISAAFPAHVLKAFVTDEDTARWKYRSARASACLCRFISTRTSSHRANAADTYTVLIRCTNLRIFVRFPVTESTHSTQSPNGAASCSRCHRVMIFSSA